MSAASAIAAVICAAGSSSRMGGNKKEYKKLSGQSTTVLGKVVRAFAAVASVEEIVIAAGENEENIARASLPPEYLSSEKPKIFFVKGGKTRRASVYNALAFLAAHNPHYVLIHDGARPWVSPSLIENIIQAAQKYGAVIPLLPIIETPKECDAPVEFSAGNEGPVFISRHLKRANIGAAQTPQGFKFAEILCAHEKAACVEDEEFTDDAEIWGRFCGQVAVIAGEKENRKITFPEDME